MKQENTKTQFTLDNRHLVEALFTEREYLVKRLCRALSLYEPSEQTDTLLEFLHEGIDYADRLIDGLIVPDGLPAEVGKQIA